MDDDALFRPHGTSFVPSPLTAGPWDPTLLHGGGVAALCATLMEEVGGVRHVSMRLTVDFVRPVPLRPLEVDIEVVRSGRRLQLLEGRVAADGVTVARGSLLRLGPEPLELPPHARPMPEPAPDRPHDLAAASLGFGYPWFGDAFELRLVDPAVFFGAGVAWFRLRRAVVAGRPVSPMARVGAVADFGNGISALVLPGQPPPFAFLNADVDIHLLRPLDGEWVRLDSHTTCLPAGLGLARSSLADRAGIVGLAQQALVLQAGRGLAGDSVEDVPDRSDTTEPADAGGP